MIGLAYLAVGAVYLTLTVWLTKRAAQAAKRRGIAGWKWGLPVVLVMYLLVLWDWIPTLLAQKYYCSKYAGFTVYKTPEQWKAENPGVAETLIADQGAKWEATGEKKEIRLNQRFKWIERHQPLLLNLSMRIDEIRDSKTHELLAVRRLVSTGLGNIELGARSSRDYKFWLSHRCDSSDGSYGVNNPKGFGQFRGSVKAMGAGGTSK